MTAFPKTAPKSAIGRALARALALALVFAMFSTAPSTAEPAELTPEDVRDIARIETYLNDIRTLEAQFFQISSNQSAAQGSLYISRPGRLRVEYEPPTPILIVADGTWLIYHDTELGQVSYIPLGSTPAGILVEDEIAFSDEDIVITDFERGPGVLRLTLVRADDPIAGSLTLVFESEPLVLRKWTVTDAQGAKTHVSLLAARFDVPLDPELFRFRDPRIFEDDF